jgi:hypothetical protein
MKIIKVRCKDYREGKLVKKINVTKNYFLEIYLKDKGYTFEIDIPSAGMHYGGFDFSDSLKEAEKKGLEYVKKDMKDLNLFTMEQEKLVEEFRKTFGNLVLQHASYPNLKYKPSYHANIRNNEYYAYIEWYRSGVEIILDFRKNPRGILRVEFYGESKYNKEFSANRMKEAKSYLLQVYKQYGA